MHVRTAVFFSALAASALLAACGGGGGGASGGGLPQGPTPCPAGYSGTPPNCVASSNTTTASGKLVDDPSGSPLAGVNVAIAPWTAGATPIPEGTTAPDGSFSFTAPNGHYLLYIGSNSTTDTMRPTIHDNIVLTGGAQALKAPTLPPIPFTTPPPMETNGTYRLMTLDQTTEIPCFSAFNAQRTSLSLPSVVEDEWLTENSREIDLYKQSPPFATGPFPWPGNLHQGLTTGGNQTVGGSDCAGVVNFAFSDSTVKPYATNPGTLWFGGNFRAYNGIFSAFGLIEYPIDPRAFADPDIPVWL